MWVGATYLFTTSCKDPKNAPATIKIKRDKDSAKKKARAQGFRYMDQVFKDKPCMSKPVNVMTYDMQPFLQSCIDRYQSLARKDSRLWPLHSMRRGSLDPNRMVYLLQLQHGSS